MKSGKFKLLSTTVTPLAAAAALAAGMTAPAAAGSDCYGQRSAALPEAKARSGEIVLAMSHEKKAPCAPNPCAAKDEAMGKAKDAANPCAAIDKGAEKAKEMANPCAAKPCAPKSQ